ncbi:MAG: hypothetical protein RLZZ256_863, partial [Bacteroidota bacterium]
MRTSPFLICLIVCLSFKTNAQVSELKTLFELSNGKQTPTYPRIIDWWKKLDALTPQVRMETRGNTDAGFPLHLVVISTDGKTDWSSIKKSGKRII